MFIRLQPLVSFQKRFLTAFHNGLRATGQKGMSLIEIIIVVALLGTIMAFMVSQITGKADMAKIDQTKLAMGNLDSNLQVYKIHNHRYPTTDQGLNALITNPGDAKGWRGPYTSDSALKDPWGVEFSYESDGKSFKIISGGLNNVIGDEDDIVYPETNNPAGN